MTFLSLDKFHCLITFINDNFFFNIKFSLLSLFFHFCMFLIHFIHLHQVSSLTSEMSRFTTHTVTNITSGAPCKAKNVTHAILTELPNFSLDGLSILHLTWNQWPPTRNTSRLNQHQLLNTISFLRQPSTLYCSQHLIRLALRALW